ncbi:MAG: uroporphyrinogen-III synthase [Actinomycetaceae bacterium]|nr:uroporphyrinogen-III synthase [Actinomycetaceae bacterium]
MLYPELTDVHLFLGRAPHSNLARALSENGLNIHAGELTHHIVRPSAEISPYIDKLAQGAYSWVCITSPKTLGLINSECAHLQQALHNATQQGTQFAAVGQSTKKSIEAYGIDVSLVATSPSSAAGLVQEFMKIEKNSIDNRPIFLPSSSIAAPLLHTQLGSMGWEVDNVPAYDTLPVDSLPHDIVHGLSQINSGQERSFFLATAPSVARAFYDLTAQSYTNIPPALAIGTSTYDTLRTEGFHVLFAFSRPDPSTICSELASYLRSH